MRQKFTAVCIAAMLLCGQAWADVDIDADNFPDAAFRDYVSENFDSDSDDVLTSAELEAVTVIPAGLTYSYSGGTMTFSGSLASDVHDLTGIANFTQLKALSFSESSSGTPLSEVDLSGNTKLEALQWKSRSSVALNLKENTELKYLACPGSVSSLTLPAGDSLIFLDCSGNDLTALDLSDAAKLEHLNASDNSIESLVLTEQNQLVRLYCSGNEDMAELALPSDRTKLAVLECQNDALEELDLTGFTSLERLDCSGNHIPYLDLSAGKISTIARSRIGGQTITKEVSIAKILPDSGYEYAFSFTQLGISDSGNVASFSASDSAGDSIRTDFPGTGTRIRLADSPAQISYTCTVTLASNGSQTMDVTMSRFREVVIEPPAITKPASGTLPAGKEQNAYSQSLTASGAEPISWDIQNLPDGLVWSADAAGTSAAISGTPTAPGRYEIPVTLTNEAGKVEQTLSLDIVGLGVHITSANFPDRYFRQYVLDTFDKDKDEWLSYAESKDVTEIDLKDSRDSITNMKGIEHFTGLTSLKLPASVQRLDTTKNTALVTLDCADASLTELDLTKNTALEELDVSSNDLARLDLSRNTALKTLKCSRNKLPELDLEANENIYTVECSPQNIAGTVTASTNPEYPYRFSLNSLITADNIGNVKEDTIKAYDSRSREIALTYNEGVIYFKEAPVDVTYDYDTESQISTVMSVAAAMTQNLDPKITTRAKLADGQKNRAYSADLKAEGTEPFSWTVYSGSLPEGLTLSEDTGRITGTPAEWDSDAFTFTAQVTGGRGGLAFRQFSLKINPADTRITTSSVRGATSGSTYSFQFEAYDPDDEHTWTLTGGSLPRGLALDSEGIISGTPSESGTYTFTVTAEGPGGTDSKEFTMIVADLPDDGGSDSGGGNSGGGSNNAVAFTITTSSMTRGTINVEYSYQLSANGAAPIRWGISSGRLPTGLSLSSSGLVSGTPKVSGRFSFTVTARNSQGYAEKELFLTIENGTDVNAPDITTQGLANAYTGRQYDVQLQASGAGTITWRLAGGSLPPGLTLSSTGRISGTPSRTGEYVFTVEASNVWGSDTMECTLNVYENQSGGNNDNNSGGNDSPDTGGNNGGNNGSNGTTQGLVTGSPRTVDSLTADELAETSNGTHSIAAVLPILTVNISGTYEIVVELNSSAPVGRTLAWHPFPQGSGDGSDMYFTDYLGNRVTVVPENRVVHVIAYFEADTYRPVITTTTGSSSGGGGGSGGDTSSSSGGGGGCTSSAGAVMLSALFGLFVRRSGRR